jgi:uncharacterized phiE125 gp8 family phage protein
MKWSQSQPSALFDVDAIKTHLRIDTDTEDDYLTGLITAAVSHAENLMGCSLLQRTITATFYSGETLNLPRGPLVSVSSVSVGGTPVSSSAYSTESYGTVDVLRFNNSYTQPYAAPVELVATYLAGYGTTPDAIPADIVQVIKCHIGLLYEQREAATDRTITPVPFVEDFYKLRSREPGVG